MNARMLGVCGQRGIATDAPGACHWLCQAHCVAIGPPIRAGCAGRLFTNHQPTLPVLTSLLTKRVATGWGCRHAT